MTTCRFVANDQPRTIRGRHGDNCPGYYDPEQGERIIDCTGCLPCTEPHCRICGSTHVDGTCAECLAETRAHLHDIARMCDALPEEVEHRGIEGEAMMLLAPAANPEARGHLEASVLAGRVSRDAIITSHVKSCEDPDECIGCAGELHPEFVLGTWESVWREALDHDEPRTLFDLAATVAYVDLTMGYMSSHPHVPFKDFALDLRRCMSHLESVLHDQSYGDRANIGCFECRQDLERRLTDTGLEDVWTCRGCRRRYTYAEYNFALRAALEKRASA